MPSARTIKARNGKYYKSNVKALGLGRGITIKIIPKIKRMPRERITTLILKETALKQYNNNPEPQKAASHDQYRTHSETIKEDARKQYKTNTEPKK